MMIVLIMKKCFSLIKGVLFVCAVKEQYLDERRHIEHAVNQYSQMLFRICFSIVCNKEDAEDALQETFLAYMTKAPVFKDSEHEKAWLIKVATNTSKNICRYRLYHGCENFDDLKNIGVLDDDRSIFEAIMRLPEKYKIVLDLYYLEGYKSNEIAHIIGISPENVRKRLQHGRKMLKHEIERD